MKIVGETAVPDGVPFPPAWPHKVLQAAVAMRHAYCKAGRAGGPPAEELERLGNVLMDVVTAELGEVLVPSDGRADGRAHLTDPFETPVSERTRSALDELPSHDHLPDAARIAFGPLRSGR
jgi:hypothetical protein